HVAAEPDPRLIFGALFAAQVGGHAGAQFIEGNGLGHVIVAPGGEARDLVRVGDAGGEDEDRAAHELADGAAEVKPVAARQVDVERYDVRAAGGLFHGLVAARRREHEVAEHGKIVAQKGDHVRFVVDDQNGVL